MPYRRQARGLGKRASRSFVLAVCASAQVLRPPQQRKRKLIVRRLASASFQATQCVRLAAEVGLGTASLATAVRVGRAYGSEVWTSETEICSKCPSRGWLRQHARRDKGAYATLTRKGLAIPNLITYHELPIADESGKATFERWPMILPKDLARG